MVEAPANRVNLYLDRDSRNFIHDGEARALYWHPYRQTYERVRRLVEVGFEIPDNLGVMLVGNNKLNPFNFDLRRKDREPLCGVESPGISGQLEFTRDIHVACGALFDRDCRRQDHLYIVPRAGMFKEINYYVLYLPTPNQPLHVRIVHRDHLEDPTIHLPPFKDRVRLAELFEEFKVC